MLFADGTEVAGVRGAVYENTWHQFNTLNTIYHTRGVAKMLRLMQNWHVEYFISPKPEMGYKIEPVALRYMLERCTEREFEDGYQTLAHLRPTCKESPSHEASVLTAGGYDDSDERIEFNGDWSLDDQFPQPWNHTVTYCDDRGASFRITF